MFSEPFPWCSHGEFFINDKRILVIISLFLVNLMLDLRMILQREITNFENFRNLENFKTAIDLKCINVSRWV